MQFKLVVYLSAFLLLIGSLSVVVEAQTTDDTETDPPPDWGQCKEGSDQMEPPKCPPEDDHGESVYFPFPYDCHQYFLCSNGLARCFKCPEGTAWDQQGTVCDHESVVGCVIVTTNRPVPTDDGDDIFNINF